MPLAIALNRECLMVTGIEVLVFQIVVVTSGWIGRLYFCYERIEVEVASHDVLGGILLWIFLHFRAPTTELLTVGDGHLAFCLCRECADGFILGDSLCADDCRSIYIIIGEGIVLLLCYVVHIYVGIDVELEEEGVIATVKIGKT